MDAMASEEGRQMSIAVSRLQLAEQRGARRFLDGEISPPFPRGDPTGETEEGREWFGYVCERTKKIAERENLLRALGVRDDE